MTWLAGCCCAGVTLDEIRDRIIDYGSRVKEADPSALVVAPEEWGWSGFLYSGADQQYGAENGWGRSPDRDAQGGMDYAPWLLQQLKLHEDRTGERYRCDQDRVEQ